MPRLTKVELQPQLEGMPQPEGRRRADIAATPLTTARRLESVIKSARDIMRKDKGLSGDLDRLPMLTWIMFLKFLDDMERIREEEAELAGELFKPAIEPPYRWRDWAANESGITGDELIAFINNDEAMRPDGVRGAGLFSYLRSLEGAEGGDRRDVIATVFRGTVNRMVSGYLLRDVINKINEIHFTSSEELHTLGTLYESMLREMRDAAGDSGEFYTPRPVVRFMVKITNPRLGEVVLDPATGTGGFLVEAYLHLDAQCQTVEDRQVLQRESIRGGEPKPIPYLLAQMNLLLHGLESPEIDPQNSLRFPLREIGDRDRVDLILTNPPFGGEEEPGIRANFPEDKRTAETALLFLQLIMRKLRRPGPSDRVGRAAVIVPHTTLFLGGVTARVREQLLREFNLHTVVRLPKGVFEPYTDIETNILFFDRSGVSDKVLYYRLNPPQGRTQYTKTQPLRYEELAECAKVIRERSDESPNAWFVSAREILRDALCNLDIHNPKVIRTTAEDPGEVNRKIAESLSGVMSGLRGGVAAVDGVKAFMSSHVEWTDVTLGNVLFRRKDALIVEDDSNYKRLRIQVKGRGVLLRDEVPGRMIGTKVQFVVREGQFVLSKIDALNGSFGIVPSECDGGIITGNFWAYDVNDEVLRPRLLRHITTSDVFLEFCSRSSSGATNRRYLQEDRFLEQVVTVPMMPAVQDTLADLLDEIAAVARTQELALADLAKRSPVLLQSTLHLVFGGTPQQLDGTSADGLIGSEVDEDDAVLT